MTRLCRAHRLHTALASLFTRALADYAAPAAELLLTAAAAPPEVTCTMLGSSGCQAWHAPGATSHL